MENNYRIAPPGFTSEQWETFNEDGIIFIEDALSEEEIDAYIAAINRVAAKHPKYTKGGYLGMENIVESDAVFAGAHRSSTTRRFRLRFVWRAAETPSEPVFPAAAWRQAV